MVDELAVDHHGVAQQQDDVGELGSPCGHVLDRVPDDVAVVDLVSRQLLRARDHLAAHAPRHLGDRLAVGGDVDGIDARRVERRLQRIGDQRPAAHRVHVLVPDRLAAGAGGDDGGVQRSISSSICRMP